MKAEYFHYRTIINICQSLPADLNRSYPREINDQQFESYSNFVTIFYSSSGLHP